MSRLSKDHLDPARCKEQVHEGGSWPRFRQCRLKHVRDGYCKQHHPEAVAARRAAADQRYKAQQENSSWAQLERLKARHFRLKTALQVIVDNGSGVAVGLAQEALDKDK